MKHAEKGQRRKKIPPTPGFELQVTQCLVGATLSSPPGGMDFFLKPKVVILYMFYSVPALQQGSATVKASSNYYLKIIA